MQLSRTLSFLLLILIFHHVQTAAPAKRVTDEEVQCNENDASCQSNIRIQPTISPEIPKDELAFKTLISAASYETISNFHEAKVAHPPHQLGLPPLVENQPTNLPGFDLPDDTSSGIEQNPSSSEETVSSGLSRVETAVLSTCGVLVIAGIAVGIFVWRNTARNRQRHTDSDLEYEYEDEQDAANRDPVRRNLIRLNPVYSVSKEQPSSVHTFQEQGSQRDRNVSPTHEQQSKLSTELSRSESQTTSQSLILTSHHLRNSLYGPMFGGAPSIEPNSQSLTSSPQAIDIVQDPSTLTYPLQKFLKSSVSATHIPLAWASPSDSVGNSPNGISNNFNNEYTCDNIQEALHHNNDQTRKSMEQPSKSAHSLGHQLVNLFNKTSNITQNTKPLTKPKHPIVKLSNDNQLAIQVYTNKPISTTVTALGFFSPLDLPEDQYVPMRDAIGLPLVSRAEVMADPIRRLGKDEIALWEEGKRKKAIEVSKQRESTLVSPATLAAPDHCSQ
ncbi:hypothetical protein A0J61_00200 [Choanephora cucurbitarum]|uniref:Uncharacterized protein n=1 Tax=Choanephora cucurbitarum TaxID=101091 RepID=A0A1C7NRH5_9FUNG|nr:hypothetical protein A0J61_00200 [Choanephora cucurbitarum]